MSGHSHSHQGLDPGPIVMSPEDRERSVRAIQFLAEQAADFDLEWNDHLLHCGICGLELKVPISRGLRSGIFKKAPEEIVILHCPTGWALFARLCGQVGSWKHARAALQAMGVPAVRTDAGTSAIESIARGGG